MKIYVNERLIHLEAMLIVALIAVTRKIFVLDTKEFTDGSLLGIAAIVFALSLGHCSVGRSRREKDVLNLERKG